MTDIIIVGGGLMGSALAHFCAADGINTALIEATVVGAGGATAHSRGIVRVYDPKSELMRWSLRGVEEWSSWSLPGPSPFVACGVSYIVDRANTATVRSTLANHDHSRYPIEILSSGSPRLAPQFAHLVQEEGIALYEPRGGYVDTRLAARLFAQSAAAHGAAVVEGSTVLRLAESDRHASVYTTHAVLNARLVILACGAATAHLIDDIDLFARSIPLSCLRDVSQEQGPRHCLVDEPSGGYLRPDRNGFFFCGGAPQQDAALPEALNPHLDQAGRYNQALSRHLLGHNEITLLDTRAGYDGYTEDFLPCLGAHPNRPRLMLATGFSGRGAKYIPAAARELTRAIRAQLYGVAL